MGLIHVLLILSILGLAALGVWKALHVSNDEVHPNIAQLAMVVLGALVALFAFVPSFGQVSAGQRGVVLQFGATTGEVKQEGLYFVMPFIQSVHISDVQVHAYKVKVMAASKDLQDVTTEITLNFKLDPAEVARVWRDLGDDYADRIIVPSTAEAVKATTAQFNAEQLVTERPTVRAGIEAMLRERLVRHGIGVDAISITNFEFSPDFAKAIEQKVVAVQTALQEQNNLEAAKFRAQQVVVGAQATAQAIKIQAEAITQQGGAEYVRLQAVQKWNGEMPQWITAGGAMPFINVPGLTAAKER